MVFVACCASEPQTQSIKVPPGFETGLFARVPGARSLALGPPGVVFVGTRGEGKVYAVRDADGDGRADEVLTLAEGLAQPNGVAFLKGNLYVAEINRILRFDDITGRLTDPPEPRVIYDGLPTEIYHGWRYIAFGPRGLLYVTIGAPCNVCDREGYGKIIRMRPDGSGVEDFAHGVRNSVGLDWHPETGVLWFTDNGRDWLGDNRPPDELNRAPETGLHFGFPYCHGAALPDPEFGAGHRCGHYVAPVQELGPHVAALGLALYDGGMFPAQYRYDVFIAEHGSWNRSEKIGYRISRVRLDDARAVGYEPFATGWLEGGRAWGRPVDVLVDRDGALLVSDDKAGAIYRISYYPK